MCTCCHIRSIWLKMHIVKINIADSRGIIDIFFIIFTNMFIASSKLNLQNFLAFIFLLDNFLINQVMKHLCSLCSLAFVINQLCSTAMSIMFLLYLVLVINQLYSTYVYYVLTRLNLFNYQLCSTYVQFLQQ